MHPAMAFSAKQLSVFFLFTFLSCSLNIHARDPQFFNKIPATTANYLPNNQQLQNNQQQPDFVPDNDNSYGLYGHESGQFSPSTTLATDSATTAAYNAESEQPLNKHLPKNYNPVAYVTEPDNLNDDDTKFSGEASFATNPNNVEQNYDNTEQDEEDPDYRTTSSINEKYYYSGGSSFNRPPELNGADFSTGVSLSRENYVNNGGNANGFQPQGMSDTRNLENGKYFYDVNTGKYSNDHPYERIRARNENANRNSYGNTGNAYRFSNGNQNQYEENYRP